MRHLVALVLLGLLRGGLSKEDSDKDGSPQLNTAAKSSGIKTLEHRLKLLKIAHGNLPELESEHLRKLEEKYMKIASPTVRNDKIFAEMTAYGIALKKKQKEQEAVLEKQIEDCRKDVFACTPHEQTTPKPRKLDPKELEVRESENRAERDARNALEHRIHKIQTTEGLRKTEIETKERASEALIRAKEESQREAIRQDEAVIKAAKMREAKAQTKSKKVDELKKQAEQLPKMIKEIDDETAAEKETIAKLKKIMQENRLDDSKHRTKREIDAQIAKIKLEVAKHKAQLQKKIVDLKAVMQARDRISQAGARIAQSSLEDAKEEERRAKDKLRLVRLSKDASDAQLLKTYKDEENTAKIDLKKEEHAAKVAEAQDKAKVDLFKKKVDQVESDMSTEETAVSAIQKTEKKALAKALKDQKIAAAKLKKAQSGTSKEDNHHLGELRKKLIDEEVAAKDKTSEAIKDVKKKILQENKEKAAAELKKQKAKLKHLDKEAAQKKDLLAKNIAAQKEIAELKSESIKKILSTEHKAIAKALKEKKTATKAYKKDEAEEKKLRDTESKELKKLISDKGGERDDLKATVESSAKSKVAKIKGSGSGSGSGGVSKQRKALAKEVEKKFKKHSQEIKDLGSKIIAALNGKGKK